MGILRAQTPQPVPSKKMIPDHLEFKRIYASSPSPQAKETFPPIRVTALDNYGGGYYVDHLGFFCKKEIDIQKTLHLPIFFRLGSLEYCNKLEGK
jgi:hypothetical protein